ncbi:MAG: hypothetical protein ACPIOQ_39530 [Promethearchaeia archaeon]
MRGQIFASFVHGKDLPILLGLLDGEGASGADPRASLLETVQQGQGDKGRSARADKQRFCATWHFLERGVRQPRVVGAIRGFRSSLESQNDAAFRSGAVD